MISNLKYCLCLCISITSMDLAFLSSLCFQPIHLVYFQHLADAHFIQFRSYFQNYTCLCIFFLNFANFYHKKKLIYLHAACPAPCIRYPFNCQPITKTGFVGSHTMHCYTPQAPRTILRLSLKRISVP